MARILRIHRKCHKGNSRNTFRRPKTMIVGLDENGEMVAEKSSSDQVLEHY